MEKLAILLTVHNRKEKTLQCLRCLDQQEYDKEKLKVEIYLTDDGSTDGTSDAVRSEFPNVHIVQGDGSLFWNRGMIAAWNEAAKEDFDFYLWLNDDTFIYQDVIDRLIVSSHNHVDQAVVVGATCAVGNHTEITYGGWAGGLVQNLTKEQKCDTFNGNIVLIPRSVYKVLGTNDPYYRHCLGDFDYGYRAKANGIEAWLAVGIMGECDKHERPTVWMDPSQPFSKRWKNFNSPTGNNPFEFFYYRKKNFGFFPACKTFISNYLHFLFPYLWKKSYKGFQQK